MGVLRSLFKTLFGRRVNVDDIVSEDIIIVYVFSIVSINQFVFIFQV
jgi:hypothetical protein